MKKIFLLSLMCAATTITFAQAPNIKDKKKQERKDRINNLIKREEEGALIYQKQTAFGVKLNTDGWGISYEHGKYKTITSTNLWWAEIGEKKNHSEEKVTSSQLVGDFILIGNPYVYGKINNFYYLKAGIGQQYLIGGKGNKNGVAVSAIYGGGISMGYLKPYYLSIDSTQTGNSFDAKYDPSNPDLFLNAANISGAAGFTKGFGEGKFVPGAFLRLALRFDYGRYNEMLSAIEAGINADYYTKDMPILLNTKEKKFFFNAYIAIEFGGRK